MALLAITLISGAVMSVDDAQEVRVPGGRQIAGDLTEGDLVCLFPDGLMPVEIQTIVTE
jgi:hypothetical protein